MPKTKKIILIIVAAVLIAVITFSCVALFSEIANKKNEIEIKDEEISELKEENTRLTSKIQSMEKDFEKEKAALEKEIYELKGFPTDENANNDSGNEKPVITISSLDEAISKQEVRVISTKYVVQDANYKSLYPDMLQAVITNESEYDIKNAVVAFVAWDKNNLPVKIKSSMDFSDGAYIRLVNYNDINLVPNDSFGRKSGYEIDETCGIVTFKAIVVSYETFDGKTWDNPLYEDWCKLYEGVKFTNIPQ